MKIKRTLALLAAVACIGMTACSSDDSSSKSDDSTASREEVSSAADSDKPADSDEDSKGEEPAQSAPDESGEDEVPAAPSKSLDEIKADYAEAEVKSPVLKEVGSFEIEGVGFKDDNIYTFKNDDEVVLYDYMGKELLGGKAEYISKLGKTGLYVYQAKGTEATIYCGIIDAQGNEIVSSDEKCGLFEELDDRFVMAFFPEAETTNGDEAIYYATKRQFSVEAQEGDVYYTGKVKVYDTKERKFLESTTESYAPRYKVCGDYISYYDNDYNEIIVSSAEDKKIELADTCSLTGSKLITCWKNDKTYAYDHDMNLLFTTPYNVSTLTDSDEFYSLCDTDNHKYGVIHYTGTVIIEPKYAGIDYLGGGYFSYQTTDDYSKKGIVDLDGKELTKDDYKYITYEGVPGCFSVCKADAKYELVNLKSGKTVSTDGDYSFSVGGYMKEGDLYAYHVIGKDDTSLKVKYSGTYFGSYILNVNNDKALYDLVTGEKLLEGFDKAYNAFGYIYVLKDGKVTVYEAE
ncbi:MAG: hypothetical protein IKP47_05815 [Ruminococcus sp.]|nr:hypothetical protein [Ruminococcus sp.]